MELPPSGSGRDTSILIQMRGRILNQPLENIRVVDFGQYIAGPASGELLANMGASVVKIEPLNGEAARHLGAFGTAMIHAYNRGKRGLALDLGQERGREVAKRLVASSDVLIQNMRPGKMEKLGLGAEDARKMNPRLVYASISGFGLNGPSRERVALDTVAQAEAGVMWVTGAPDGDPQRVGFTMVDAATSHVVAEAVLAALFQRERTGVGETIEVSLLEVALQMQAVNWADFFINKHEPVRRGNGYTHVAPAGDLIKTLDGYVVLSAYSDSHWKTLCRAIDREDMLTDSRFVDNPSRVANRSELLAILEALFGKRSSEECVRWMAQSGIVIGAVRSFPQVEASADVEATGIFVDGPSVNGVTERYVASPYTVGGVRPNSAQPAPLVGEHSLEVLSDYGISPEEVGELVRDGVVLVTSGE